MPTPYLRRLIGLLLVGVLLSGCSLLDAGQRPESPAPTPAVPEIVGEGRVAQGERRTVSVDAAQPVRLSAPQLPEPGYQGLRALLDAGLVVSPPVHIDTPQIPASGVAISRTYPEPLPAELAATMVFFDSASGAWVPVAAELSADRRTLTATVQHLSWWTDVLSGPADAVEAARASFAGAGAAMQDVGAGIAESWTEFDRSVQDAFRGTGDFLFYWTGRIFDTRVEAPTCTDRLPDWVDKVQLITDHQNNPYRWCAGADPDRSDRLIVKMRVNRGYPALARIRAPHDGLRNGGYDQQLVSSMLDGLLDHDPSLAPAFDWHTSGGVLVFGGAELEVGFSRDQVARFDDKPLIEMEQPGGAPLVTAILARPFADAGVDLFAPAWAGAAYGAAVCHAEFSGARDAADHGAAAVECLGQQFDEEMSKAVAAALVRAGRTPEQAAAGGASVTKVSAYLALIGPLFASMSAVGDVVAGPEVGRARLSLKPPPRTGWVPCSGAVWALEGTDSNGTIVFARCADGLGLYSDGRKQSAWTAEESFSFGANAISPDGSRRIIVQDARTERELMFMANSGNRSVTRMLPVTRRYPAAGASSGTSPSPRATTGSGVTSCPVTSAMRATLRAQQIPVADSTSMRARCAGDWVRLSVSGPGDMILRRQGSGWRWYTSFPSSVCLSEFRAAGGPAAFEQGFRPC